MNAYEEITYRLENLSNKFDQRFDRLEDKMEKTEEKNNTVRINLAERLAKVETRGKILWPIIGTVGVGLLGVVLKMFFDV